MSSTNSNFNSMNDLFSSFNINNNLNTTTNLTPFYSNEITTPIIVPPPQMVMSSPEINQTYIPTSSLIYGHTGIPSPTPTAFYHGHTYVPIPPTPTPTTNNGNVTPSTNNGNVIPSTNNGNVTPSINHPVVNMPTPAPYIIHHSVGGNHPVGWTPAWGATGTHPPGSSFGHSGHTGQWSNNKKNVLFTNKFAFEEKDFSIKIYYLEDEKNGILNRLYELKCNELSIKTILKINEDTFEVMSNKKFDKIVELLEKLSKMNLYYSNICKSILVKDIFINKKITSKFVIEI
jgi:hypothetical protein